MSLGESQTHFHSLFFVVGWPVFPQWRIESQRGSSVARDSRWIGSVLAIKLIVDNWIGHTMGKQAIHAYGRSLRLFCVATCMIYVFAIALTAKDILDMTGRVDSSFYTEDVVCSPNQAWYLALGSAMFGLFSCVLTYYLIEFQYRKK